MPTILRSSWVSETTFIKFVEDANNFKKLAEVGKNFAKFRKFAINLTNFVGLANNSYKGSRSREQLWKVCET